MKKRIISMMLVVILTLSLCACGEKPTKEELLEMPRVSGNETSIRSNPVKAKEEHVGKVKTGGGRVIQITSEYVEFGSPAKDGSTPNIERVYLPKEEIEQLKLDRSAYYIGLIDDYTYDKDTDVACLVATGHITSLTETLKNVTVIKFDEIIHNGVEEYCIVKSSATFPVFFEDESVLNTLEVGDKISIEFTLVHSNLFECGYYLENAKLIESE